MNLVKNLQKNEAKEVLNQVITNNTPHQQNNVSATGNENTSFGEVGGDVTIYAAGMPQEKEVFKDPTENFTLQENVQPLYMNEEALQQTLAEMYQERIIFLGGKSGSNVVATLHNIIKKYEPDAPQEHRWLSFWGKNNAQRNIYLDSVTEEAFPQNALVAIDITKNKASDTFLKSIVEMPEQGAIEIRNTLRAKNLTIICYFNDTRQVQTLTNQKKGNFSFHFWDTSPPINTIQEFISAFDYSKLYDKNHSVFKYILYVATFFPRTSPKEFKKIVDVLLSEKKDEILTDATREMSDKDEILKRTEALRTRSLLYLWEQQTDDFFEACGLAIEQENDLQKVDFVDARDREAYKHYFKSKMPFFLLEQFDNLVNSGLPFAPDTSDQTIEYFIQISCELAKNDPHFYGTKLLHKVSSLFKSFATNEDSPTDIVSTLRLFLVELTYAMLKLDNMLLTERIEFFLFEHLDYRYEINKTPRNLLADITFELKAMEGFDKYRWIELMMGLGKKETKNIAYYLLLRLADSYQENAQDLYDFLEEGIGEWLPKSEKTTPWEQKEAQTSIESYSLSFIVDYWGFYKLDEFNLLAHVNPHLLASWLFNSRLEIGYHNRSKYLPLRDIKHDGSKQGNVLSVDQKNICRVIDKARAILTEVWFRKLTSLETPQEPVKGNKPASQKYVELFVQYANREQKLALIEGWEKQIQDYSVQIRNLDRHDKKKRKQQRQEILTKQENLRDLKGRFSKLAGVSLTSKKGCFPLVGLFAKLTGM
ncbi:hypothetical protein [Microscilla marina]|uniref:Uncharacterized protein n=1 Tax=Microscilla marina ATCC 23134 TaxID=313606 RepID=A1ZE84_MICM2|nr:hypothetical protein [Microscilla marina]EAY31392.1 hypothetical protein M23134_04225 [Microscilla marina ATCC 23134]